VTFRQSSLFRRLMFSFAGVIVSVAIIGVLWMFYEAKVTQRTREW
jgi:two-component system OmpR family sensor kinase